LCNVESKVPDDVWPEFKARATACNETAAPALAPGVSARRYGILAAASIA
jgi:hypothetical protein